MIRFYDRLKENIMKRFKWACMLMLLAAVLLASTFTAEAAKIKLNKKKVTQPCNTAMTVLELKGADKGKVVWKTSNKKVASCDSNSSNHCIVVSHRAGKAKIKAKYKGKTYTCKVTVKDKPAITPSTLSVDVGESHYVSVWGTAKKVTWSIADKSIAQLQKVQKYTYTVKGLKAGKTKLKAKVGKKTLTCTITVLKKEMFPMEEAFNGILDTEKPYAFGVEDLDLDGSSELMTLALSDSKVVLKFYCWNGKAADPAGTITIDRTEWEEFLICYGSGYISVSRGHTYHFNESAVNYTLADGTLTELEDTEVNLKAKA